MKNKQAVLFVLGLMLGVVGFSYAGVGVRGAKVTQTVFGTTNTIGVSSTTAVVYSVVLGTGAVTDFVTLFDSNSVVGLTNTQTVANYKIRLYPTSATANTNVTFDPPLQFNNGIMVIPGTALGTMMITFEKGRVTQGY